MVREKLGTPALTYALWWHETVYRNEHRSYIVMKSMLFIKITSCLQVMIQHAVGL